MTGAGQDLFEVERLSLSYPALRGRPAAKILDDVSFKVPAGGSLVLVGPSGSGKSTLLRCLNRLEEPTSGEVRFGGQDIRALQPRLLRRQAALVMQTPVLFEGTVRANLQLRPPGLDGDVSDPRLVSALRDVGLPADLLDRDAATLSGGEKQRVTIARAVLGKPRALLLDEPTSALDPPNAATVVEAIVRLRATLGLTVIAATHQRDLLALLGGELLYLVGGTIESRAPVTEVTAGRADPGLLSFLSGETS